MSPRSAWLCACVLHEASAHGSSSESESAGRLLRGSVLFTCADRVRAHFWCGMLGCAILGPAKLKCHRPASGLRCSAYTRKHILSHFANTCSRRLHRHRLVRKAEIVLASHAHFSILEFRQIIVRNARRRKKRALLRACSCPDQRRKAFALRHVSGCPPSCQCGMRQHIATCYNRSEERNRPLVAAAQRSFVCIPARQAFLPASRSRTRSHAPAAPRNAPGGCNAGGEKWADASCSWCSTRVHCSAVSGRASVGVLAADAASWPSLTSFWSRQIADMPASPESESAGVNMQRLSASAVRSAQTWHKKMRAYLVKLHRHTAPRSHRRICAHAYNELFTDCFHFRFRRARAHARGILSVPHRALALCAPGGRGVSEWI